MKIDSSGRIVDKDQKAGETAFYKHDADEQGIMQVAKATERSSCSRVVMSDQRRAKESKRQLCRGQDQARCGQDSHALKLC